MEGGTPDRYRLEILRAQSNAIAATRKSILQGLQAELGYVEIP